MTSRFRRILCGFALLMAPGIARAHAPFEDLSGLYNGLLHPVLVPAHVLALLALGLFVGRQDGLRRPMVFWTYPASLLVGLTIALFGGEQRAFEIALLIATAITGLLVALDARIPRAGLLLVAGCVGALLGLDSGLDGLSFVERGAGLFGSAITLYLLMLYPALFAESFRDAHWKQVTVRVLGSWTAAIAILVLSLTLAGAR